jgi:hypothetical protein
MNVKKLAAELTVEIEKAYVNSPTMEEAEKLAAKFLAAQMHIANELAVMDLDARMKKAGMKRVRAAVYAETVSSSDKKPTEAMITSIIDTDELVERAQTDFDTAEVEVELLRSYYSIFREGHIYFRGIAKGSFGG